MDDPYKHETEEIKALWEHSQMLGRIACEVEEFSLGEGCTTLECVQLAVNELRKMKAEREIMRISDRYFRD